ncbi:RING-H2 finger protein [Trichinella spiralis]|uniref:RING-H2 finger protein n=1 Tax=Trichinella spiralis TaxID=6334 RepID=A0ABR3KIX7_TRISP
MENYLKKLSDIRSKLKKKFKIKACGHFLEIDFVETAISNKIPFRCARVGCRNNHYIKRNDLELIEIVEDESEEVVSLQIIRKIGAVYSLILQSRLKKKEPFGNLQH